MCMCEFICMLAGECVYASMHTCECVRTYVFKGSTILLKIIY